ncbi:MAG: hypothetical protein Q9187_006262 [Circinaria calcarea]
MFSLTLITMIFSIIRVEISIRGPREDNTWYYLGTTIEISIAIIIACLVSYRSLFTRDKSPGFSDKAKPGGKLLNKSYPKPAYLPTETNVTQIVGEGSSGSLSPTLGTKAIPLDIIRVRDEYTVDAHDAATAREEGNRV